MKMYYFPILVLSILFVPIQMVAQLLVSPNPVFIENMDFDAFETVGYSTVTNESGLGVGVIWTREEIMMTEGWTSAICDINQCYLSFISTQNFYLASAAEGNIDVHLYPNGIEGSAVIAVHLALATDPEEIITSAMFYFNTTLSTAERLVENIKLYPNPTTDMVWIDGEHGVHTVEVFSLEGKLVKQSMVAGTAALSMADLPKGSYILRLKDLRGDLLSSSVVLRN
jgi:hypothetical protein